MAINAAVLQYVSAYQPCQTVIIGIEYKKLNLSVLCSPKPASFQWIWTKFDMLTSQEWSRVRIFFLFIISLTN